MFTVVFEYRIRDGEEREFERVYGPAGEWVAFFRRGDGYLGSDLYRALERPRTYLVVDRWTTQAAYDAFLSRHAEEYERRASASEARYEQETRLGAFRLVGEAS